MVRVKNFVALLLICVVAYPLICSGICRIMEIQQNMVNDSVQSCCHPEQNSGEQHPDNCCQNHHVFQKIIGQFFKDSEVLLHYQLASILQDFPQHQMQGVNHLLTTSFFSDSGPPITGQAIRVHICSYLI